MADQTTALEQEVKMKRAPDVFRGGGVVAAVPRRLKPTFAVSPSRVANERGWRGHVLSELVGSPVGPQSGFWRYAQRSSASRDLRREWSLDSRLLGRLAHLEGESSNTLFEVLDEWERHLTQLDPMGPGCDDDQPKP